MRVRLQENSAIQNYDWLEVFYRASSAGRTFGAAHRGENGNSCRSKNEPWWNLAGPQSAAVRRPGSLCGVYRHGVDYCPEREAAGFCGRRLQADQETVLGEVST